MNKEVFPQFYLVLLITFTNQLVTEHCIQVFQEHTRVTQNAEAQIYKSVQQKVNRFSRFILADEINIRFCGGSHKFHSHFFLQAPPQRHLFEMRVKGFVRTNVIGDDISCQQISLIRHCDKPLCLSNPGLVVVDVIPCEDRKARNFEYETAINNLETNQK